MEHEQFTRRDVLALAGAAGLAALGVTNPLGAAVLSHYERTVLAKKPVAYWRLGEATGPDASDRTGNGHRGAYRGTPTFRERGAIRGDPDTAIGLDGRRSYVEVPDHPDFSQPTSGKGLTVEVWVRPDLLRFEGETDAGYIHWLGKGAPKKHEWALRFYSGRSKDRPHRISAYLFNPEGGLGAGAFFQDEPKAGEWLHVVACYEPGDASTKGRPGVHIYKNGEHRLGPPSPGTLYNNPRWRIKPAHGSAPLRLGTYSLKGFLTGGLDEDGLGLLFSQEAYLTYHHVLCHNLLGCVVWALVAGLLARDRLRCVTLTVLNRHLHLAGDYFGSRGPWGARPWVLPYLLPAVGGWSGGEFTGPAWYWNPWQWPLNAWPNVLVTAVALAGWAYVAVRLDRTWFEFVWPRFDGEVCRVLRKWFGGRATDQWAPGEEAVIRRGYLVVTVAALLACVVAASRTM